MSARLWAALALFAFIAALLTACGGSDNPPDEPHETIDPPSCAASGACT